MERKNKIISQLFDETRLFATMREENLDAVIAHSEHNFYYLTGFNSLDYRIDPGAANFVIIPHIRECKPFVTIPASEQLELIKTPTWVPNQIVCGKFYIRNFPPNENNESNTWEGLVKGIRDCKLEDKQVGFELDSLPVNLYERLKYSFPELNIVDASPYLAQTRMIKTDEEIKRIRIACEITEQAINDAAAAIQPGVTEQELAKRIAHGIIERDGEVLYVQVATGSSAGLGMPTNRPFHVGDIIRTDVAAIFEGYTSDLGRGFVVGPPSKEQELYYETAYKALQAGIEAVRPNVTAENVFNSAMAVWENAGFRDVKRHHVGHGIGLQAHEAPILKPGNHEQIQTGMVLAVEVPCYVHGLGGFAPEDILLVGEQSNIQFTHAPASMQIVG